MHTTNQLLDALAAKLGPRYGVERVSDYRLGKVLGASGGTVIRSWRKGRSSLSLDYAVRVAKLLDWPVEYVMACAEAERAAKDDRLEQTSDIVKGWQRIADKFRPALGAALLCVMGLAAAKSTASGSDLSGNFAAHSIHYAHLELAAATST